MKKIKFYLSIFIAKCIYLMLKITKLSSGTAIIGLIVLKICPKFLSFANNYVTKYKINVTGTNGKTTTSAILAHILSKNNKSIIYNSTGANMLNGIVNSIALQLNLFKKSEYSVIETDEAFLDKLYEKYDADYLLVTNLFNDQLDRFGSVENTKELIQNAINKTANLQLILNADDPCTSPLTSSKEAIYYGVEDVIYEEDNEYPKAQNHEEVLCSCGKNLEYSKQFYSKIGHYFCDCGFARPKPKYNATIKIKSDSCIIILNGIDYIVPVIGLFNAYNALGAIVLALETGIEPCDITRALPSYKVFSGRCEYKMLNGHKALIQLIKNPVGATEVLKTVDLESNIFIGINDNYADGKDFTWINDADFEIIKDAKKEIVVAGIRAKEMGERLEKAGCKKVKVINNVKMAVKYLEKIADDNITMLPSYTVLQELDKIKELKKI